MDEDFDEDEDLGGEDQKTEEVGYFTSFEKAFHETLNSMRDNEALAAFGEEYTKLFEAFEETYKREQVLITDKVDLEDKVKNLESKIHNYVFQSEKDNKQLENLKEELETAWKLCDNAHAREQTSQEIIENMRSQIVKLNNEMEALNKRDSDDVGDANLNKTKEGFEREKQRLLDEIISLKQKLANALSYSEDLEHKNSAADLRNNELSNLLEEAAANAAKQQRTIDKLNADMKTTNDEKGKLNQDFADLTETLNQMTKTSTILENNLKEQRNQNEKCRKENELLNIKLEKYKLEMEIMGTEMKELKEKMHKKASLMKELEEESNKLKSDFNKLSKQRENMEKRLELAEKTKNIMETERNKLRQTTSMMEKELQMLRKQADTDKRNIENMNREKEILQKNLIRVQNVSEQHVKLIKIQEQSKRKMENDLNNMKNEVQQQKKEMHKMEKERNRAIEETMDLTQQVEDAMDEIKLKQQEIYELKRTLLETESKLRQQQNLFEVVRADRNAFQKQLQESLAECGELRAKLKISTHQAEQLKEDIAAKEAMLLKSENILRKVNKEKENLKVEVQNGLDYIQRLKKDIHELQQSEKRLTKNVQENEMTIRGQAKDLEQIMNDRDIIGAQLVRRNDELGLLYEKINILQITLRRGETQYDQRIEDIRLLKLEIKRLRQERNLLSKQIQAMTDMRHEVFQLERELAQERLKTKAMEEEIQHPLNIHRWRKLEGSDPQVLELLQKIQILQKRLLASNSQAVEREKQLKETERLYLNLRQVLARQPGPEIKEELGKTRKALQFRGTKMKCLVSELNMCESQMHEYKMDLERLTEELKEVKAKYLRQKKLNQKHLVPSAKKVIVEDTPSTKFTGGGFKMAPQPQTKHEPDPCHCDL